MKKSDIVRFLLCRFTASPFRFVVPEEEVSEQVLVLFHAAFPPAVWKIEENSVEQSSPQRRTLRQPRAVHLKQHTPT